MSDFQERLAGRVGKAVRHYWVTRVTQHKRQGRAKGRRDQGLRGAVTGGAQLDGFVRLVAELLGESGLGDADVFTRRRETILPGFFRPTRAWDLVAVADGRLVACVEFKSQAGPSFGNNFNNRVEEALGNATDFWKAYEQGVFQPSSRPFLGYIMLLERAAGSTSPVRADEPHFAVPEAFRDASYADRYRVFCTRLLRERMYDGAALLMASEEEGLSGRFSEPAEELSFAAFAAALMGKAFAFAKQR